MKITLELGHSEGAVWEKDLPYFVTNYKVTIGSKDFRLRCHRQFGSDNIQFHDDQWCDVEKMNAMLMSLAKRNEEEYNKMQTFIINSVLTIGNQILVASEHCHTKLYYETGE